MRTLPTWVSTVTAIIVAALLGAVAGPYGPFATYDLVDRLWPHEHSVATWNYLMGGISGAFQAMWVGVGGMLFGGIGLGAVTFRLLSPGRAGQRACLWLGVVALGMLWILPMVLEGRLAWWMNHVRHQVLLQAGFPTLVGLALLAAGLWPDHRR